MAGLLPDNFAVIGDIAGTAFTTVYNILFASAVAGGVGGAYYAYKYAKQFDIDVRIYSKRKNGYKTWDDVGAYLKNAKTNDVYAFKLKNDKTTLQPPSFDFLIPSAKGRNTLHLLQLTSDEYFVLEPMIDDPTSPDLKNTGIKLKVIEGDIQLWAVSELEKTFAMFQRKSWFDKYGSFLLFGIAVVGIFLLFYTLLNKFDVLVSLASSLDSTAQTLKEVAVALANLKASGVAVPVAVGA